ncbi:MAG TPA: response regulator transcription factor [Patescibacteria group bacterium]|nr:response regulator transcription factor [Patescibacteria group bacterium]
MKILIIDDDKEIVALIKKSLSAQSWLVECAYNGSQGLKMIKNGGYSILILDLSLPKISGREIIKQVRNSKNKIPIIILSVQSEIGDKKELFSLGADDYLTKPFLIDELIIRIKALLRRPEKIEIKNLRLGSLVFNRERNLFSRKGKEIYLTKKEHNLLLFFLKQKNKIVSKGEILEHVWNYNSSPFSNSIETHIAGLRQKINILKEPNLIHTFSGRGYKLSITKLA